MPADHSPTLSECKLCLQRQSVEHLVGTLTTPDEQGHPTDRRVAVCAQCYVKNVETRITALVTMRDRWMREADELRRPHAALVAVLRVAERYDELDIKDHAEMKAFRRDLKAAIAAAREVVRD